MVSQGRALEDLAKTQHLNLALLIPPSLGKRAGAPGLGLYPDLPCAGIVMLSCFEMALLHNKPRHYSHRRRMFEQLDCDTARTISIMLPDTDLAR